MEVAPPGSLCGENRNAPIVTVLVYDNIVCFNNLSSCACCSCVLVCIFVVHQLSYNYLSAWIVTFTCLAIASSVACIFHALIFISALISSFVLPEFVVRIFEPVDVVDVSTFCLYVLPDIIVAIFSIATLYYTMRERSRMANSLRLWWIIQIMGKRRIMALKGGFGGSQCAFKVFVLLLFKRNGN